MRIVAISDTHGLHDVMAPLPEGDFLVHAGDGTGRGSLLEIRRWAQYLAEQPHKHKIAIAGNHDWAFQDQDRERARQIMWEAGIHYLQDSSVTLKGIKFYGSPWQPEFCNWAFNLPWNGDLLRETWSKIPGDTDVLITHGPPLGILDRVESGELVGCRLLREAVLGRVKPKVHIFGHIHESHGVKVVEGTTFINASTCTSNYRPTQSAETFDIPEGSEPKGL